MTTPKKPPSRVQQARARLDDAITAHIGAHGRAEWINGYRVGNLDKEAEYHAQEMAQWKRVEISGVAVEKALAAYARAIRQEERTRCASRS